MRLKWYVCSCLSLALIGVGTAFATEITSDVTSSAIWGSGGSPYVVTSDIAVAAEAVLTIEAGEGDAAEAAKRAGEIDAEWGPIDILVNNAGIMPAGGVLDHGIDEFRQCLAVNTVAPFALIRSLAPGMLRRRWGRIVNVSSGWGSFAERLGGPVAYSASKAALNAITVTAAAELDRCVKVNAVCPGWVRTRMGGPDATRSPEEAADTPVWLATLPDDGPTGGFFRRRVAIDW